MTSMGKYENFINIYFCRILKQACPEQPDTSHVAAILQYFPNVQQSAVYYCSFGKSNTNKSDEDDVTLLKALKSKRMRKSFRLHVQHECTLLLSV